MIISKAVGTKAALYDRAATKPTPSFTAAAAAEKRPAEIGKHFKVRDNQR